MIKVFGKEPVNVEVTESRFMINNFDESGVSVTLILERAEAEDLLKQLNGLLASGPYNPKVMIKAPTMESVISVAGQPLVSRVTDFFDKSGSEVATPNMEDFQQSLDLEWS